MWIENFMQQNIASIASLHHLLGRSRIPRQHNLPVPSLEHISIRLFQIPCFHRKPHHRHILIPIHHSRPNLVHRNFVSSRIQPLPAGLPHPLIFPPRLARYGTELALRSHADHPASSGSFRPNAQQRKKRIRIPAVWIGIQMRVIKRFRFRRLQRRNAFFPPRCRTHHPRPAIHRISPIVATIATAQPNRLRISRRVQSPTSATRVPEPPPPLKNFGPPHPRSEPQQRNAPNASPTTKQIPASESVCENHFLFHLPKTTTQEMSSARKTFCKNVILSEAGKRSAPRAVRRTAARTRPLSRPLTSPAP